MQTIDEQIQNIRTHADVLMKIPSGELFIGHIQSVISIALTDIARILEQMQKKESKDVNAKKRRRNSSGNV